MKRISDNFVRKDSSDIKRKKLNVSLVKNRSSGKYNNSQNIIQSVAS